MQQFASLSLLSPTDLVRYRYRVTMRAITQAAVPYALSLPWHKERCVAARARRLVEDHPPGELEQLTLIRTPNFYLWR